MIPAIDRRTWLWLGAIVAIGLALRIAGAQGGLWLDEAWSAKLAHDAGTPLGIFLNINHDNNHHLNSLWLQFVGFDASPLLARSLSIVTSTLGIVVAAVIAAPRGRTAMLATGWLFAVSPMLVTLGSEARGYAPMALALLAAIAIVDRQLAGSGYRAQRALALCFFLGALSQLTIVFGVCAIVGWYAVTIWLRDGFIPAVTATLRLFAVPLAGLAAALTLVFVPALLSPTGFKFGSYDPFDLLHYLHGVGDMVGYTVALPVSNGLPIVVGLMLVLVGRIVRTSNFVLYALAILAFPLTLALLHAGNVAHARYYLTATLALLLLIGELIAIGWQAGGWRRWVAGAGLLAISIAAIVVDVDLSRDRRGDMTAAIRSVQARAPGGAAVILDRVTGYALVEQSAAYRHYPVTIQQGGCPPQRFLFADRFRGETFPREILRCGARYLPIDGRRARGLSGMHWTLYERRP